MSEAGADVEHEDQVDTESPASPVAPRRSRERPLAIVALVCFVAAVVLGVVAASVANSLQHERNDRDEVRRAASTFAGQLLTFDYRTLPELRSKVKAMSTPRFAREYDRAFPGLQQLITAGKTTSKGSVTDVYVGDLDHDSASVIAVVRTTTSGVAGGRTGDFYMQLDMATSGGDWKVDGFTNLNFSGGAAPSTPTTAAPPG